MKHIAYNENGRDMGERFSAKSMEEIVAWFFDSHRHHVGSDPYISRVVRLIKTGALVVLSGDVEHEWTIW